MREHDRAITNQLYGLASEIHLAKLAIDEQRARPAEIEALAQLMRRVADDLDAWRAQR